MNQLNFNRLSSEKSLFLQSMSTQSIHWQSYSEETIQKAKNDNLPIFLSIGYNSNHWCHEMANECFQNLEVANFLNENFICILVDKDEFPDLDSYYQKTLPYFGKNGGWPLNVFLRNDLKTFFAGTYFSLNSSQENGIGFLDLIKEMHRAYHQDRAQVDKNAEHIFEKIKEGYILGEKIKFEGHFPNPSSIMQAISEYRDLNNGGFKTVPKFPQQAFYEWALEQMLEGMISKEQGEFIVQTLEKQLCGGINDIARGGFHRYGQDAMWKVPNFEKTLYDQAQFLKVMNKLSLIYPSPLVFDSIINTLDYLEKEMLSENGYFFSSQASASEGVEGLYFTFTENEFEDAINQVDDENETLSKEMNKIKNWYQISTEGNYQNQLNVISLNSAMKEEFYQQENWNIVRKVNRAIVNERKNRIPPKTDSKGIASHNFMLLTALIDLIQYSPIDVIKNMASQLVKNSYEKIFNSFIQLKESMRLNHSTTNLLPYPLFEDYVSFLELQVRLYEISADEIFKNNARDCHKFILQEFIDQDRILTRAKFSNDYVHHFNDEFNCFDQSFKSLAASFVLISKRLAVLFKDQEVLDLLSSIEEKMGQTILKINPVNAGEALRALTYPIEAYRVIRVPKSFSTDEKFKSIMAYFLHRFVLDYHTEDEKTWMIENMKEVELKGMGLDEFIQTITPKVEG